MAKEEENIFYKFYVTQTLDLASAFWIFGVIVSALAGFIFGYLFFNDFPDIYEVTGSLIISLSGLFIIYREYKVGVSQDSSVKDVINRGT